MFDYNVTIGESLRSVIALLEKDEEEKTHHPKLPYQNQYDPTGQRFS